MTRQLAPAELTVQALFQAQPRNTGHHPQRRIGLQRAKP